jgi:UDP-N-acetylmuramyl pentapeptide phosphotransferase/UDP-N-acetylglucosamine-1-phosphate transferase
MIWLFFTCFLVSFLGGVLLIRGSRHHARRYGAEMPQRFHLGDVPRLGGLALLAGAAWGWGRMALAPWLGDVGNLGPVNRMTWYWLPVLVPAVLGGVCEDLTQRVGVRWRLLLTGGSGLLAVALLKVTVPRLGLPGLDTVLHMAPWLGALLALLAITGLPHAFNIIDGYNGLAGTVALIVCAALIHVALQVGDRQLAAVLVVAVGATAGFMVWNYPRGMLFAGDGGAYFWGLVIALASVRLVQQHAQVSPWFPMLLLIYPVWETVFSIYRKAARGGSPGVADALHFHQLIYRRIVREVFHDDDSRRMLMRNNRTSPYLWGFTCLTVAPAVLFWRNTPVLIGFCALFVATYVAAYLMIVRFKAQRWTRPRG